MSRKSQTLEAQCPQLSHVGVAQRRPVTEETRHAFVAALPRLLNLLVVEVRQVLGKAFDHDPTFDYDASKPRGTPRGRLSSPNHFRILAAKLRVTCMRTSALPPLPAQWPVRSKRKERLGALIVSAPARRRLPDGLSVRRVR